MRQRSYKFFLKDGYLWRWIKNKGEDPLRVVGDEESRKRIMGECHKGIQSMYERVIVLYWWPVVYREVREYV